MRPLSASLATAALLAVVAAAPPATLAAPLEKTTTSYATIGGDAGAPYSRLTLRPGWKRVVRDDLGATARKGRLARRRSLMYFAQLSDFQLADEESPARAEVRLLEGGRLNPNSGVENAVCGPLAGPAGEAARYTGVADPRKR